MEILGSLVAIIFGVIGVFFMLNLSLDLEWWFWLTIILLIFASLGEWFK